MTIQAVLLGSTLLLWEWAVASSPSALVPRPSQCVVALYHLLFDGEVFADLFASLGRVSVGFGIAVFVGLLMGFLFGMIPTLKQIIVGVLELLRPIPPIAWIPIAVALLGIGNPSAWFVIFIGAFYPVLTNALLGVTSVERLHLEAAKVLGASKLRSFRHVIWPSSLPSIFAGLRVGLGFAWMCVVAAEMFASRSGLGYQIQLNRQLLRLDRVVAYMVIIAAVGFAMSRLMALLEWTFVPWRRGHIARDFFETANVGRTELTAPRIAPNSSSRSDSYSSHNADGDTAATHDWKPAYGISVSVKDVEFSYSGTVPILKDINLTVRPGEIFCLLGVSGCGKTTLLRLLAGLEVADSGSISIDGGELHGHRADVTMVFQNFSLFPWKTVEKNVRFAVEQRAIENGKWDEEAGRMLRIVGLQHKTNSYPHQLSGGQQQRVAFARALANRPRLLLLDEPLSALDSYTREILQVEISRIFRRAGSTVVMVTHDITEAVFLADRIAIMSRHGGQIIVEFAVSWTGPRDRQFRQSPEYRELADVLWQRMQSEETALKHAANSKVPVVPSSCTGDDQ